MMKRYIRAKSTDPPSLDQYKLLYKRKIFVKLHVANDADDDEDELSTTNVQQVQVHANALEH